MAATCQLSLHSVSTEMPSVGQMSLVSAELKYTVSTSHIEILQVKLSRRRPGKTFYMWWHSWISYGMAYVIFGTGHVKVAIAFLTIKQKTMFWAWARVWAECGCMWPYLHNLPYLPTTYTLSIHSSKKHNDQAGQGDEWSGFTLEVLHRSHSQPATYPVTYPPSNLIHSTTL